MPWCASSDDGLWDQWDLQGTVTPEAVQRLVTYGLGIDAERVRARFDKRVVYVDVQGISVDENRKLAAYLYRQLPASWGWSVNRPEDA